MRWLTAAALALLALVIVAERSHTADEPIERDIASHAVIAHEMLAGRALYSDLWDAKPPAVWLTYAAADALVGYGPRQIFWLGVAAAVLTMLGVFAAVRTLADRTAALLAAAAWAVASGDLALWANQPNIEVFMNVALVWAFVLLLRAPAERADLPRFGAIGALAFVASLYKPVAPAVVAAWAAVYVAAPPGGRARRRTAIARMGTVAAVAAACWALVFAFFAATGRGTLFFDTIVRHGAWYTTSRGGNVAANTVAAFGARGLFHHALSGVWPLAVLFVAATAIGIARGPRRPWALLLAYAVGAQAAVGLPGRLYPHYFLLQLPVLATAAGLAFRADPERRGGPLAVVRRVGAVAALVVVTGVELNNYGLSADEWSAKKYGPQFVESRRLAERLASVLRPAESMYVWGIDPEIYFWARKSPPDGVIWSWDTMDGPLAPELARAASEALKRKPPTVVVVNRMQLRMPASNPVVAWIEQSYAPVPGGSRDDRFAVWAPPDQELRGRFAGVAHLSGRAAPS